MTHEKAIEELKARKEHYEMGENCKFLVEALEKGIEALENQKTGHWENTQLIPNNMTGHTYGECSICGKLRIVSNYCPNCGAKMDIE